MNKTYAILSHLSGFLLGFLGPLIFFLVAEDEETKAHAREALNYQITFFIYEILLLILFFVLIPPLTDPTIVVLILILLAIILSIKVFICMIIAAVKAGNGEEYRYPLNIRFIKQTS